MAKVNGKANGRANCDATKAVPRSIAIAETGVQTDRDMMALHSVMIADVLSGRLDRRVASTVIAGSRNMLKIVELRMQNGGGGKGGAKMIEF